MYHILIVDDEQTERACLRYLIEQFSFPCEFMEASDGKMALEILKDWKADIIFTDVKMPIMNGLDFIKELSILPYTPKIIVFSSYAEFEYAKVALCLGVENYILKPVIPNELRRTLEEVIGKIEMEKNTLQSQQSYFFQHAVHMAITGNPTFDTLSETVKEQLSQFETMLLLDFPPSFLERYYGNCYEALSKTLPCHFELVNLSPQLLLLLPNFNTDMNHFATELLEYMERTFATTCYIAISKPLSEYSSFKVAFDEIEQQMELRFWNPKHHLFTPKQQVDTTEFQPEFSDDTWINLIKSALSSRDYDNLNQTLQSFFTKFRQPIHQSQIYVKFIFSNLIATLFPFLPKEYKDKQPSIDNLISSLYLQQNIEDMIDTVEVLSSEIIKEFEQEKPQIRKELIIVQDYIHSHYNEELSIEYLASIVYLSPDYLSKLFKKNVGISLYQYIRQFRMKKASELLLTTTKKVIDIGNETGYPNYSYFCQSFREYYGISPDKYRQEKQL